MAIPILHSAAAELTPQQEAQYTYERQQDQLSKELTAKAEKLRGSWQGQCVTAVKKFLNVGNEQLHGYARNTVVNSHDPEVGSIIVLRMSYAGHVGVTLFTTPDKVWYYDSNGDWRQRAAIRSIAITDPRIRGYHKVQ